MPRKKPPTEQEAELNSDSRPQDDSHQAKSNPSNAVSSTVSHTTIARCLVIGAVGTVVFGIGLTCWIVWMFTVGAILTLAGPLVYLSVARRAENAPPRNWARITLFLLLAAIALIASGWIGRYIALTLGFPPVGKAVDIIINSTPPPNLTPTPATSRILRNGEIAVDITPEFFDDLEKSTEFTSKQIAEKRRSYFDKWIIFSGVLDDVWDKEKDGSLYVIIRREKGNVYTWFKDDAEKDAVRQLRKGEQVTVLCRISHADGREDFIMYLSCELVR